MGILNWIMEGNVPFIAVILLGVVVSVCPCTIAANVSALTCMLRQNKDSFFSLSAAYILARTVIYTLVGVLLILFVGKVEFTANAQLWIGRVAGPLFILIGLFMLDVIHIHGLENKCIVWMNRIFSEKYSLWSAFLLGLVLAFAFCPYSSAIYFGLMLPMSCASDWGVLFPFLFSIGAALPLIFIAWVMFKGMESKLDVWNKFQHFEYWFRKIIAVIFIITGLLFVWEYFLD